MSKYGNRIDSMRQESFPCASARVDDIKAAHALVPCKAEEAYQVEKWTDELVVAGIATQREALVWMDLVTAE